MKKIALVGCGRISKRHIEAIEVNNDIKIVAVCDIDKTKASMLGNKLNVPFFTDYVELSGKGIDVVSILTPSGMHPRHAIDIIKDTDIPYIVCEKPISLTVREAYELFSVVDKSGKFLLPVYQNRYNPLVQFIKKMIDSGKLGKIYHFTCNVFWNRNDEYFAIDWHGSQELDGGVLYTQASHYVDMVHYLFGEINEHKGIGGNMRGFEVFDSIAATMSFKNGTIGTLNATVDVFEKNYLTEFTLIGEKGTVRLSGTNLNKIDFWNVEDMENPDIDFTLDHVYGKGHDLLYQYIAEERWDMFPSKDDVISGIRMMEMLSY